MRQVGFVLSVKAQSQSNPILDLNDLAIYLLPTPLCEYPELQEMVTMYFFRKHSWFPR